MTRMQIAQILRALTIALATADMKAMASIALVIQSIFIKFEAYLRN